MKVVANVTNQAVVAVVNGETLRFNAREEKILDATVLDHPDFKQYVELLVIVGDYYKEAPQEITPQPEPVVVQEPEVVDIQNTEDPSPLVVEDTVVEDKPKRRKAKN